MTNHTAGTPEEMAHHLNACIEQNDGGAAFIAALGDIAQAHGLKQAASDAGLYGAESPAFAAVLKVIQALGLKLHASQL